METKAALAQDTDATTPLDGLHRQMALKVPFMPYAELMSFEMVHAVSGEVDIQMNAGRQHHNPMGTVNGGALCSLADAAMGMTMVSVLTADESFTTLEQKTNFLKPVWQGKLIAQGRLLRDGKTVTLVEAKIYDEKHSLVAYAVSTCMKLRGDQTKNREVKTAH
jgi:uncharacterized protein (TIGR00369 family)